MVALDGDGLLGQRLVAGPVTRPSAMENALPWHAQLMLPPATPLTMQPWWVQTAVKH